MDQKHSTRPWQTWRGAVTLSLIAVCLTVLTLFVADNFGVVEVRLFFVTLKTRLAWSLLLAAALGFAIGLLTARLRR